MGLQLSFLIICLYLMFSMHYAYTFVKKTKRGKKLIKEAADQAIVFSEETVAKMAVIMGFIWIPIEIKYQIKLYIFRCKINRRLKKSIKNERRINKSLETLKAKDQSSPHLQIELTMSLMATKNKISLLKETIKTLDEIW